MSRHRILVTGSRDWTDTRVIADGLIAAIEHGPDDLFGHHPTHGAYLHWGQITVVHGAARGADRFAARIARAWGMVVEPHPADWKTHGRAAGHRRNAHMVALGADVCIAFPLGASRGTRGCMALAEAAGIPVLEFTPAEVPS